MIGYFMLGTNDVDRATQFYDGLLTLLGATRAYRIDTLAAWRGPDGGPLLTLTRPFDGQVATAGNGTMVALQVADSATVDRLHALALSLGASNEGDPGPRGRAFYAGYFRDPDGNKLNLHCHLKEGLQA